MIIGTGSQGTLDARYMPNGFWGEMQWDFDIYDKAGNKTRASTHVYVASRAPQTAPEPVAIYTGAATNYLGQPALQGFVPYTSGMTIYQNPVRMLYRVPRDEYYGGGGRGDIYGAWVNPPAGPNTSHILYSDSKGRITVVYWQDPGNTDLTIQDIIRVLEFPSIFQRPANMRL